MLLRKAATVVRTAEGMGSAVNQVVTRHAFQDRPSAPSMVRTGSAQSMGASETTTAGEEVFVIITTLKWPALLKAAATMHT